MNVRTRNLLDRFRTLILPNVLIVENSSSLNITTVLHMLKIRELAEAAELARIIHSEINSNLVNGDTLVNQAQDQINEISGLSHWTRQLMLRVVQETHKTIKNPHDELQEVLNLMIRKSKSSNLNRITIENECFIRKFPEIVRNFYESVDWKLPEY